MFDYGVAARPFHGESESGDQHAVIPRSDGWLVVVADGLGHGYEAAVAAKLGIITLTKHAHLPLLQLVGTCHEALVGTRGVAMSVALLDTTNEAVTWISIGNVAGLLMRINAQGALEREHIMMRSGVVGHRLPPLRTATLKLQRGDLLIFATDGVREGFQKGITLGAGTEDTAASILRRYGRPTDDALVLVARWHGPPLSERYGGEIGPAIAREVNEP